MWDPEYKQIFCLLFAEKLSYKVCDESIAELDKISQGKQGIHSSICSYIAVKLNNLPYS